MKPLTNEKPIVYTPEQLDEIAAKLPYAAVAEVEIIEIAERGGPGSGHFGHAGRPGEVGGSAASGGGPEAADRETRVGVTSYKEGRSPREVFAEGREFAQNLSAIPGVRDAQFRPGLGIYEGAEEPTWIVSYHGNGEAARLIAQTAQAANQNTVLMMFPAKEGDSQPVTDIVFDETMYPADRKAVIEAMAEAGIEDATWGKNAAGEAFLRVAAVPDWGFEAASQQAAVSTLAEALTASGYHPRREEASAAVRVMEMSGPKSYDEWTSGRIAPP